jgi:hypothetical protein
MPAKISSAIRQRDARIKLFLCDVDDVLTDGLIGRGLKARDMKAQGNALGLPAPIFLSPERAKQKWRDCLVAPLQGASFFGFVSQGVALGCHVNALSARKNARPETNHKAKTMGTQCRAINVVCF